MNNRKIIVSAVIWCISVFVGFWMGYRVLPACYEMNEAFWTFTIVLLPACFFLSIMSPYAGWLCPILMFWAISIGVGSDALTDTTMDRNLWGIEAIIAEAMAVPGIAIGGFAGVFLSYRIRRK